MGLWGKWFRSRRRQAAGKVNDAAFRRRGEPALARAREVVRQRGWVLLEQDEELLAQALDQLGTFGFSPSFIPDMAYVAFRLDGDLTRFRRAPHSLLLRLRNLEDQPLFNRVVLPDPDGVSDQDAYVDLLWEAAAAAGTSEYLSGVNWGMDFSDTRRGVVNYTLARRRHSVRIIIAAARWDPVALRELTTSVTPSHFDLIFQGTELFCWVAVKQADRFLALLPGEPA